MSETSVHEKDLSSPEDAGTRRNSTVTSTTATGESGESQGANDAASSVWPLDSESMMRMPLRARGYSDLSMAASTVMGVPPPTDAGGADDRYDPHVNLNAVNEGLIGQPVLAPMNTPTSMTSMTPTMAAMRGSPYQAMHTINESLEHLPESAQDVNGNILRTASMATLMDALTTCTQSTESSEFGTPLTKQGPRPQHSRGMSGTPASDAATIGDDGPMMQQTPVKASISANDGVLEETDWQEEVISEVEMAHARLLQLARDKHRREPSKSIQTHYLKLLRDAVARSSMDIAVNAGKDLMKFVEKVIELEKKQEATEQQLKTQDVQLAERIVEFEKKQEATEQQRKAEHGQFAETLIMLEQMAHDSRYEADDMVKNMYECQRYMEQNDLKSARMNEVINKQDQQIKAQQDIIAAMQLTITPLQETASVHKAKIAGLRAQNDNYYTQLQVHIEESEARYAELSTLKKVVRDKLKRQDQSLSELRSGFESAVGSPLNSPVIQVGSPFLKSPLEGSGTPILGSPATSPSVKPNEWSGASSASGSVSGSVSGSASGSRRPSNYDLDAPEPSKR